MLTHLAVILGPRRLPLDRLAPQRALPPLLVQTPHRQVFILVTPARDELFCAIEAHVVVENLADPLLDLLAQLGRGMQRLDRLDDLVDGSCADRERFESAADELDPSGGRGRKGRGGKGDGAEGRRRGKVLCQQGVRVQLEAGS